MHVMLHAQAVGWVFGNVLVEALVCNLEALVGCQVQLTFKRAEWNFRRILIYHDCFSYRDGLVMLDMLSSPATWLAMSVVSSWFLMHHRKLWWLLGCPFFVHLEIDGQRQGKSMPLRERATLGNTQIRSTPLNQCSALVTCGCPSHTPCKVYNVILSFCMYGNVRYHAFIHRYTRMFTGSLHSGIVHVSFVIIVKSMQLDKEHNASTDQWGHCCFECSGTRPNSPLGAAVLTCV